MPYTPRSACGNDTAGLSPAKLFPCKECYSGWSLNVRNTGSLAMCLCIRVMQLGRAQCCKKKVVTSFAPDSTGTLDKKRAFRTYRFITNVHSLMTPVYIRRTFYRRRD